MIFEEYDTLEVKTPLVRQRQRRYTKLTKDKEEGAILRFDFAVDDKSICAKRLECENCDKPFKPEAGEFELSCPACHLIPWPVVKTKVYHELEFTILPSLMAIFRRKWDKPVNKEFLQEKLNEISDFIVDQVTDQVDDERPKGEK